MAEGHPAVEWGATTQFRSGESTGGDVGIVNTVPGGALVAAVDGVGHGLEAARAAAAAAEAIRRFAGHDLIPLLRTCDEVLRRTRGAAMSLALFSVSSSTLTWLGIGNVEGRLVSPDLMPRRSHVSLRLVSGVLGRGLPRVLPATLGVKRGDVLVFATDGISSAFADSLRPTGPPREIAERIMADHHKVADDALALVVRYLGAST